MKHRAMRFSIGFRNSTLCGKLILKHMIRIDKKLTLWRISYAMRSILSALLILAFAMCAISSCRAKKVDCPAYGQKPVEKTQQNI
jgi:hypothetical protein